MRLYGMKILFLKFNWLANLLYCLDLNLINIKIHCLWVMFIDRVLFLLKNMFIRNINKKL